MGQYINDCILKTLAGQISKEKPLLGICLGMQLLTEGSEEGHLPGLSIVSNSCKKFQPSKVFKVPHMGWNYVEPCNSSKLLANIFKPKFYFVHSYFLSCPVFPHATVFECKKA